MIIKSLQKNAKIIAEKKARVLLLVNYFTIAIAI